MSSASENPPPASTAPAAPRIDFDLACVHCGNPLNGAPLDGNCPTCSKPIGDTLDPDLIDLPTATVSADIPCPQCGYNLRTLGTGSVCPECGQAVSPALVRSPLEFAGRPWRHSTSQGIIRLRVVGWITPVFMVVYLVRMSVSGSKGLPDAFLFAVCCTAVSLIWASGVIKATARNKRLPQLDLSPGKNRLARFSAILACILFIAATGLIAWWPSLPNHGLLEICVAFSLCLAGLLAIISVGLLAVHLRQVARQANRLRLAKNTNLWLGVITIWAALALATVLIVSILPWLQVHLSFGVIICIAGGFVLAAIPLHIAGIIGLSAYRRLISPPDGEYGLKRPL